MAILVVYSLNKDKKTANMFVDGYLINEDIPFIPHLATDHRGAALYFYAKEQGLEWEDFDLDVVTINASEVKRGYDYLFSPKHVVESIQERLAAPFRTIFGK